MVLVILSSFTAELSYLERLIILVRCLSSVDSDSGWFGIHSKDADVLKCAELWGKSFACKHILKDSLK